MLSTQETETPFIVREESNMTFFEERTSLNSKRTQQPIVVSCHQNAERLIGPCLFEMLFLSQLMFRYFAGVFIEKQRWMVGVAVSARRSRGAVFGRVFEGAFETV